MEEKPGDSQRDNEIEFSARGACKGGLDFPNKITSLIIPMFPFILEDG
jgi:hypothetical protein